METSHLDPIMQAILEPVRLHHAGMQAAFTADRQYIDAAQARIRELEVKLAYAERTIDEQTEQLAAMPHYPMIVELLGRAYHTLQPNRYIGEAHQNADTSRSHIAEALELMGIKQP